MAEVVTLEEPADLGARGHVPDVDAAVEVGDEERPAVAGEDGRRDDLAVPQPDRPEPGNCPFGEGVAVQVQTGRLAGGASQVRQLGRGRSGRRSGIGPALGERPVVE
jgi:hypothetical protein